LGDVYKRQIDGVPQSTTRNITRDLATIDPAAIERIEVVRGTTSIYGEGATGGIISISTKRPAEGGLRFNTDIGGSTSLSHPSDSFGGFVRQTVTGKRGKWDFLVNGAFDRTGGLFDAEGDRLAPDPHGQGGLADTNSYNVLGKIGFDITRRQRLQFTANRYYSVQDTEYASDPIVDTLPALSAKSRARRGLVMDEDQDTGNSLFNLDYSNDDIFGSRLQGQIYHRDYFARFFPFDGRAFPIFGRTIFQSRLEQKKTGGRLALETALPKWTGLTAVYGVDHVNERTSQPVGIMDPAAFDASGGLEFRKVRDSLFVPLIDQRNTGIFAQFEWKRLKKLVLRGGIRHERINVKIDDFTTIAGNFIRGGKLDYADTLFNAGAVYYASDVVSFFGNFGQGFTVPDIGLVLRGSPAGATINSLPFAAQKVDTYETGIRLGWNRAQASFAAFYNTSDLGSSSGGFNQPVIRAPEKVYGAEAVLDTQPTDRLRLGGTFTWLEGESDPNLDGIYTYLNSYRIPPMKMTAYAEHDTLSNWFNRLQLTYSGERNRFGSSTGFGLRPVEDYATVDYLSTVRLPRGTLRFGVENLLNRQYFTRESQLLSTGFNNSYTPAQGATLSFGYSIGY
ncbi:MAG: TonB-dependent receptor, partial [Pyrinomonadaceae bacterium]|nr:TonB-dependent receptor [Pyrinomonadaceae bacterium]